MILLMQSFAARISLLNDKRSLDLQLVLSKNIYDMHAVLVCTDLLLECLRMNWRLHLQPLCRAERLSELLMLQFPPLTQQAWTAGHNEVESL